MPTTIHKKNHITFYDNLGHDNPYRRYRSVLNWIPEAGPSPLAHQLWPR